MAQIKRIYRLATDDCDSLGWSCLCNTFSKQKQLVLYLLRLSRIKKRSQKNLDCNQISLSKVFMSPRIDQPSNFDNKSMNMLFWIHKKVLSTKSYSKDGCCLSLDFVQVDSSITQPNLGSGCCTVVEHTPRTRELEDSNPAECLAFFLFSILSVVCP